MQKKIFYTICFVLMTLAGMSQSVITGDKKAANEAAAVQTDNNTQKESGKAVSMGRNPVLITTSDNNNSGETNIPSTGTEKLTSVEKKPE